MCQYRFGVTPKGTTSIPTTVKHYELLQTIR